MHLLQRPFHRSRMSRVQQLALVSTFLMLVSGVLLVRRPGTAHADASYLFSWTGTNSTMAGQQGGPDNQEQFVQDFIYSAVVQPDGTIWTSSGWDEAGHEYGEYRNGQVVGAGENLSNNNHNLNNDSARSVTDHNGVTWAIQNSTFVGGNAVCRTDNTSICITGSNGFRPNAVAIANDGTLMVGDNGPDQQIKFYDVSSGNPSSTPVRTFGDQGGVWAGPTPGLTGPTRFSGIWGTGQDSSGNIYVIGNFPGGGTWMRSLTPDGNMNWQLYGNIWLGNGAPDMATNGGDVYNANTLFKMDYTQTTPGTETSGDFPYAVTVDWFNQPNDGRLTTADDNNTYPIDTAATSDAHYAMGTVPKWVRDCYGQKYLFVSGMYSGQLGIFKQQGLLWIPATFNNGPSDWPWAEYVDTNCDLWQADANGSVSLYPANGADGSGNLSFGSPNHYAQITDFNEVDRIQYDRANDILYLSGYTNARPRGGGWGDAGSEFMRYSNWSSSPTHDLTIDIPYNFVKNPDGSDNTGASVILKDWDISGSYLFGTFVAFNDSNGQRGSPSIWSLSDGSRVANPTTTSPVPQDSTGWVDVKGITSGLRSNGEYLIYIEDDFRNKTLLYRWCPSGNCPEN